MHSIERMELLWRFVLGGLLVSVFSVLGDSLKPKSFAGLFGAAPSVALAGFFLGWMKHGSNYVAIEAYSMIFGALAMILYCVSAALIVRNSRLPPGPATGLLWVEWLGAALLLYVVLLK